MKPATFDDIVTKEDIEAIIEQIGKTENYLISTMAKLDSHLIRLMFILFLCGNMIMAGIIFAIA